VDLNVHNYNIFYYRFKLSNQYTIILTAYTSVLRL